MINSQSSLPEIPQKGSRNLSYASLDVARAANHINKKVFEEQHGMSGKSPTRNIGKITTVQHSPNKNSDYGDSVNYDYAPSL